MIFGKSLSPLYCPCRRSDVAVGRMGSIEDGRINITQSDGVYFGLLPQGSYERVSFDPNLEKDDI